MEELIIDPEIQSKIPALTEDEFKQLEKNILEEGRIFTPIICWNNVIVDGHNRYKIARKHPEIPCQVEQRDFNDKYEAIVWMCHNQLGRRNLTPEARKVLIGTAYETQKMAHGGDHGYDRDEKGRFAPNLETSKLGEDKSLTPTVAAIMEQFDGVSSSEINKAARVTRGVNAAEEISPGFKDSYVSGEIKSPDYAIKKIPKVPEDIRPSLVKAIEEGDTKRARKIIKESTLEKPKKPFFVEPEGKFDAEDFGKELQIVVERMDDSFNRYFVREYADMLLEESGRKAAYDALKRGRDILDDYKEVVDSYNS